MGDTQFDRIARTLGTGLSRRSVLAALGTVGLGTRDLAARGRKGGPDAARKKKCLPDSPPDLCCKADGTCACKSPVLKPGSDSQMNGAKLQSAIDAAAPGSVLRLAAGIYDVPSRTLENGWILNALLIEKPLTLARCGDGEVILRGGMELGGVGNYEASTVFADWGAGAVCLKGLTVTTGAERVVNTGIFAIGAGPASVMLVVDCLVRDNTDSGITMINGNYTIAGTTVRNNRESRFGGGGIRFNPDTGPDSRLTIVDSVIENNTALSFWPESSPGFGGVGGGLLAYGPANGGKSTISLKGTSVTGNFAGPENIVAAAFLGSGWGAGIFVQDTSLAIEGNSTVEGNRARVGAEGGGFGGGLGVYRSLHPIAAPMSVTVAAGSHIRRNVAESLDAGFMVVRGEGGGIWAAVRSSDASIVVAAGTVTDNEPDDCVGAVSCGAASTTSRSPDRRAPRDGSSRRPWRD